VSWTTEEALENFTSEIMGATSESEGLDKKHMKVGFICTDSGLHSTEVAASGMTSSFPKQLLTFFAFPLPHEQARFLSQKSLWRLILIISDGSSEFCSVRGMQVGP